MSISCRLALSPLTTPLTHSLTHSMSFMLFNINLAYGEACHINILSQLRFIGNNRVEQENGNPELSAPQTFKVLLKDFKSRVKESHTLRKEHGWFWSTSCETWWLFGGVVANSESKVPQVTMLYHEVRLIKMVLKPFQWLHLRN